MDEHKSTFLSVMVVGEHPEELMEKYSKSLKVKPYIKYRYLDAEKLKDNTSRTLTEILNNSDKFAFNDFQRDYFKERLKAINSMSSFEYYSAITNGLYYDDEGNALSEENPNGKWNTYSLGKNFSYPLKLNDGKEVYQARAKDINWQEMNMNYEHVRLFSTIWQLAVNNDEPTNEQEKALKATWINRKNYLSRFRNEDEFIAHNCAYWNYAFLDETGWHDVDDENNENKWIAEFFERFIDKLKDDDLVTIYEYSVLN